MEITQEQLEHVRQHLRVDGHEEDELIRAYTAAAIDYAEKYCDGVFVTTLTPPDSEGVPPREILFSPGIWSAILLIIGGWYSNRETAGRSVSKSADDILFHYRRWR